MKFSALILSALSAQTVAWAASLQVAMVSPQTRKCGNPANTVAFLRGVQPSTSDHFYTTSAKEMENAVANLKFNSEGIAGHIFTTQELGTTPLFRLFNPTVSDHFYTTSAAERNNAVTSLGYTDEGTAGFVYTDAKCGGSPLFRLYNVGSSDHLYTMSVAERNSAAAGGYVYEGIAAFIYPVQARTCGNPDDTVAFLRGVQPSTGDHFYTTSAGEMEKAVAYLKFNSEGIAGHIFTTQELATTPLFRLLNPTVSDHFYTTSAVERNSAVASLGYIDEGTAGFVYTDAKCGGSPLFRLYNVGSSDHFYTMSIAERNSAAAGGYVYEGIAAFIYPADYK
ncbi:hypothetical protein C8J56DRAFT_1160022 [Mycena floridula]|nr:hypothetical protein C8J56DRAFT_1042683 [Mycena floridula]KAJ7595627.1 hypothetical protein C8J56DRAFT_1160022 [Mycena floridula]